MLDPDYAIYLLLLLFAVAYALVSIAAYYSFILRYDWDLAVYNQTFWVVLNFGSVNGVVFWNTLNFGHFHVHFEPIMFGMLGIYAISQTPETLLVFGSFMLRLGALPLYWLARDTLNSKRLGLLFALIYLTYAPLLGISWFFFPVTLAIPFLLFSFYYFEKKQWFRFLVFTVLALMTKETISLVVFFMGIYFLWENRVKIRTLIGKPVMLLKDRGTFFPIFVIVLSLLWFIIALRVMAFFTSISPWRGSTINVNLVWWSDFGTDFSSVVGGIVLRPLNTMGLLGNHVLSDSIYGPSGFSNLLSMAMLFVPLLFVPLLGFESLLIPLPYVVLYLLSNNPFFWAPRGHHAAPVIPFIFIACIQGAKRLKKISGWLAQNEKMLSIKRVFNPSFLKVVLALMLVVNVFATVFYFPQEFFWGTRFPLELPSWSPVSLHDSALREVIALIPSNASVLTHTSLLPYVSHRLYLFPGWRSDIQFDYVLVDTTDATFMFPPGKYWQFQTLAETLQGLWVNGDLGVVTAVDGIWLLKRGLNKQIGLEEIVSPGGHGLIATFYKNNATVFSSVFLEVGPQSDYWSTAWETLSPSPSSSVSSFGGASPYIIAHPFAFGEVSPFVTVHPFLSVSSPFNTVFTGFLYVPQSGEYAFLSRSEGSVKLVVDGAVVIDNEKRLDETNTTNVIFDEEGAEFWTLRNVGSGSHAVLLEDENTVVADGTKSLAFHIVNGSNSFVGAYHSYDLVQDWSQMDFLSLDWYGTGSGNRFRIVVGTVTDDFDNRFVYTFGDFWTGWRKLIVPLSRFSSELGNPSWVKVKTFLVENALYSKKIGTLYIDRVELIQAKKPLNNTGSVWLEKGWHNIQILFGADEGHANVHLEWLPPWKEAWEVLPGENLYMNRTNAGGI